MHRVDTEGHAAGLFQDGNPQVGQQGTLLAAEWLNDLQENLATVIEDAGIALVKGDAEQLKNAIAAMITAGSSGAVTAARTPVGTVIQGLWSAAPTGYLALNGGQHVRATYPDLVAFLIAQGLIVAGDTGAQFRVPNYMGRFARAWSTDATVDPEGPRVPGSVQADAFASHQHVVSPTTADSEGGAGRTVTGATGTSESLTGYSTALTGGAETRPKNVAMLWAIKT